MVAYMFVLLGVVRERVALTVIFLDIILYSVGGVIGTMHHLYFSGEPAEHMALGAFFSAAEVIPLTFLTVEAWSFLQLGAAQESRSATPFPHRWAVMFLVAVGFWNFLGAGIFGFLINLPDRLLLRDRHRADRQPRPRGDDGRLRDARDRPRAVLPALPDPGRAWPERWARISFWSTNIGLAWMCFATLLPLGILQLYKSVDDGLLRGARAQVPDQRHERGDRVAAAARATSLFIVGGAIPVLYIAYLGVRHTVKRVTLDEPEDILFTEITEPEGIAAISRRGGLGGEAQRERRGRCWPPATPLLLIGGAFALEWLSAHTHRRSLRYRTAGFTYHEDLDHWLCPEGEHLWPHEIDHERRARPLPGQGARLQRLRQQASLHGLGPRAARSSGRSTPGRTPRPGASTGQSRFCSSRSARSSLLVELARHHAPLELALIVPALALTLFAARWLLRDLRRHPANFPAPA